eukprot:CAMPEP_0180270496 /NCGR_PEP_ID=MMETSP0988-20121125/3217_1 /TAXON_ID=697907 /ORGANISM="non described non described, Strain CCMP2293" /LENGTH=50 /DNA_ID=CAMNT_0022241453 /DNA_START=210 /DNA_END=358 /DNA_ORIENTATION=-
MAAKWATSLWASEGRSGDDAPLVAPEEDAGGLTDSCSRNRAIASDSPILS